LIHYCRAATCRSCGDALFAFHLPHGCVAMQAVVAAAPDLATNIPSTCALFSSAQGCAETMSTLLTPFNASEPGAAAQALCYAKLPELFMPRRASVAPWSASCASLDAPPALEIGIFLPAGMTSTTMAISPTESSSTTVPSPPGASSTTGSSTQMRALTMVAMVVPCSLAIA
jgi:hypothetical protein